MSEEKKATYSELKKSVVAIGLVASGADCIDSVDLSPLLDLIDEHLKEVQSTEAHFIELACAVEELSDENVGLEARVAELENEVAELDRKRHYLTEILDEVDPNWHKR